MSCKCARVWVLLVGRPAAAAAAAAAAPSSVAGTAMSDKQRISTEILAAGFVQAFVDFFHLTHRPDPDPGGAVAVAV